MIRWRRSGRTSPVAADGDLVIDGRIRARLLGLPLLDLDAHVVVGPARGSAIASAAPRRAAGQATVPAPAWRVPAVDGPGANGAPHSALGRAVRLLGEGSTALDDARRIRRRALTAAPGRAHDAATRRRG